MAVSINYTDGFLQITAVGGETDLDFDFPIFDKAHLTIIRTRSGTDTTLVLNTDYTIADGEVGVEAGGTAVLNVAAVAADVYTLLLDVPEERTTDFNQAGDFLAATLNREFDLQTQMLQGVRRDVGKAATLPSTSSLTSLTLPNPVASQLLGWNSAATGLQNYTSTDLSGTVVSTFINTLLDDATATEAQQTLNVEVGVDTQAYSANLDTFSTKTFIDDDTMATASATAIPSSESVKAYVDATYLSGQSVQVVHTQTGTVATGTTQIPSDNTIPQNTEGDEYMTLAITPTSATNKLKIEVVYNGTHSAISRNTVALFQDSTANALAASQFVNAAADYEGQVCFCHVMTAGTTSATTFKVRAGGNTAGTTSFNGSGGVQRYGGVYASSITITEIKV